MHEAATNLGSRSWTRFRRITLPLIRPGLFAGATIVFIWSFTELGTPLMLGYLRVTPVQIFNGITELQTNPQPYALVIILLAVSSGLYALSRLLFGQHHSSSPTKGMTSGQIQRPSRPMQLVVLLPFLGITALAALPHAGVVLLSVARDWYGTVLPNSWTIQHYQDALSHNFVVPSILNSLIYSVLAMLLCLVIGLTVSLICERWKPPGWQAFDILSMLPLAIPGIIMAFGYLSMASRYPTLKQWMDPIENPTILLIIAYAVRRIPYVVRAASAGLQQTPIQLEEAAANLGAPPALVLKRILVPLIAANLIAGALFAFSFSMLEVSDSLILAQKAAYFPITRAIYELAGVLGSGSVIACAFGTWAMVFLATTLFVANRLLGKKMGALFRF